MASPNGANDNAFGRVGHGKVPWHEAQVESLARSILNHIPERARMMIFDDYALAGLQVITLPEDAFPTRIPSGFFLMDVVLRFDSIMKGRLLLKPGQKESTKQDKVVMAKEEMERLKRLLSARRAAAAAQQESADEAEAAEEEESEPGTPDEAASDPETDTDTCAKQMSSTDVPDGEDGEESDSQDSEKTLILGQTSDRDSDLDEASQDQDVEMSDSEPEPTRSVLKRKRSCYDVEAESLKVNGPKPKCSAKKRNKGKASFRRGVQKANKTKKAKKGEGTSEGRVQDPKGNLCDVTVDVLLRAKAYYIKKATPAGRLGQISWKKFGGPHPAWCIALDQAACGNAGKS
ncbi:unnamed protein product [Durusdinium trenchii]|uniref:Uncharacterized protein n=1 Tax=Durusdinium trenchii TaxID=1381693 RepID=A0ABP0QYR9_9DINO